MDVTKIASLPGAALRHQITVFTDKEQLCQLTPAGQAYLDALLAERAKRDRGREIAKQAVASIAPGIIAVLQTDEALRKAGFQMAAPSDRDPQP